MGVLVVVLIVMPRGYMQQGSTWFKVGFGVVESIGALIFIWV